jgi:hypothetical protein
VSILSAKCNFVRAECQLILWGTTYIEQNTVLYTDTKIDNVMQITDAKLDTYEIDINWKKISCPRICYWKTALNI